MLRIATNGIASFCIDNKLRQMAFFVLGKGGKRAAFAESFELKIALSVVVCFVNYYIKQIDSMLSCVCSVINHRRRQHVVRTSVTHSAIASCVVLTTF